ncbi:hypothetical protein [Sinorhizobium meliloti]|uniref:hypothetical protein n=1 Tax=Rhizobium meliloti TaxID=382 RepID=UPI003D6489A6
MSVDEKAVGGAPTASDILEALAHSGYLMEQRVASTLERSGFNVRTNRAYEDIDEGKSREIDVSAMRSYHVDTENKITLTIELVIECKNFKQPVVFITRKKNEFDRKEARKEHVFPFAHYYLPVPGQGNTVYPKDPFFFFGLDQNDPLFLSDQKAVQFCRIDGHRKKWEANHSGMHESILLPVIKATASRRNEIANYKAKDWTHVWLGYSVVVLSHDLFSVDSHNPDKVAAEKWVTLVRETKSTTLTGKFAINFVSEKDIAEFVERNIYPVAEHMKTVIIQDPEKVKSQHAVER